MQRPGKDISFKAIRSKYSDRRGIELRERSSRSLLANVLDIGTVIITYYVRLDLALNPDNKKNIFLNIKENNKLEINYLFFFDQ